VVIQANTDLGIRAGRPSEVQPRLDTLLIDRIVEGWTTQPSTGQIEGIRAPCPEDGPIGAPETAVSFHKWVRGRPR